MDYWSILVLIHKLLILLFIKRYYTHLIYACTYVGGFTIKSTQRLTHELAATSTEKGARGGEDRWGSNKGITGKYLSCDSFSPTVCSGVFASHHHSPRDQEWVSTDLLGDPSQARPALRKPGLGFGVGGGLFLFVLAFFLEWGHREGGMWTVTSLYFQFQKINSGLLLCALNTITHFKWLNGEVKKWCDSSFGNIPHTRSGMKRHSPKIGSP